MDDQSRASFVRVAAVLEYGIVSPSKGQPDLCRGSDFPSPGVHQ